MLLALGGCASGSLVSEVTGAVFRDKFGLTQNATENLRLNPAYQYLQVEATGAQPALLVLGYVDAHPLGNIEVWYSSQGEVLKLQNGRIVGTAGLALDWRRVSFPVAPPAWLTLSPDGALLSRLHDEFPGYRLGIEQRLQVKPGSAAPPTILPSNLTPALAARYQWFLETPVNPADAAVPPSWYALGPYQGQQMVIFSRQCLSAVLCLKIQRWPPEKDRL